MIGMTITRVHQAMEVPGLVIQETGIECSAAVVGVYLLMAAGPLPETVSIWTLTIMPSGSGLHFS